MTPAVHFTVYLVATGAIVRTGACGAADVAAQAKEGEAILVGDRGNPAAERVELVDGEPELVPRDP